MKYTDLLREVDREILELRAIARFIKTSSFEDVYVNATPDARDELDMCICDYEYVKLWYTENLAAMKELGEMTTRELKRLARTKQVLNYSRLTKEELIRELTRKD